MVADVVLQHLGHEAVHRPASTGDETQYLTTLGFVIQGARDCVDLAPDPGHALAEFGLILNDMRHWGEVYPTILYARKPPAPARAWAGPPINPRRGGRRGPSASPHALQDWRLLGSMRSIHFDVQGFSRTYWDLFVAAGFSVGVFYLFAAVLAWQLGGPPAETLAVVRVTVWALALCFAAILALMCFVRARGAAAPDKAMIHVVLIGVIARYEGRVIDALRCRPLPRAQPSRAPYCE